MARLSVLRRLGTLVALATTTLTLTATAASAAAQQSSASAAPQATATCKIQIQNPHPSTHVAGTMNVVATVNCTAQVSHIALFVTLYNNGKSPGAAANDVFFTSSDSENSSAPCQLQHQYRGTASAEIWFATGPPKFTNVVNSPTVLNTICGPGPA